MLEVQLTADDYAAANFAHFNTRLSWLRSGLVVALLFGFGVWMLFTSENSYLGPIFIFYGD